MPKQLPLVSKPGILNFGNRIPIHDLCNEIPTQGLSLASSGQLGVSVVDGGTSRLRKRTPLGWGNADMSLVYQNFYLSGGVGEISGPSTITLGAVTVEYPLSTFTTVFFNGSATATIAPGQTIISDPIPLEIPPNTIYWVRTYHTVPAPGQVSPGFPKGSPTLDPLGLDLTNNGNNYFANGGDGSNHAADTSYLWVTDFTYPYGPSAVIGTPMGNIGYTPVVGIIGDSIIWGQGNNAAPGGSYLDYALHFAGIPFYNMADPAELGSSISNPSKLRNRMVFLSACSSIVWAFGTNDIFVGLQSFATVRTNALSTIKMSTAYGAPVWVCTTLPQTTSSDSWHSNSGQSPKTGNAVRLQWNAYLRAPASAGAGNSLAFDLTALNIKFGGLIDIANLAETNPIGTVPIQGTYLLDADRWYTIAPPSGATADGIHPATGTHHFLQTFMPIGDFV